MLLEALRKIPGHTDLTKLQKDNNENVKHIKTSKLDRLIPFEPEKRPKVKILKHSSLDSSSSKANSDLYKMQSQRHKSFSQTTNTQRDIAEV